MLILAGCVMHSISPPSARLEEDASTCLEQTSQAAPAGFCHATECTMPTFRT